MMGNHTTTRIAGSNPAFEDSELVLALVAPVGTNFDKFQNLLTRCLASFGYKPNFVSLSGLARNFRTEDILIESGLSTEAARIEELMHKGNYLRFTSGLGEFLALAAAKKISDARPVEEVEGQPPRRGVLLKTAHVVRSLKHPDEVRALRRIYGAGFFLIAVTVSDAQRRSYLRDDKGCSSAEVDHLLGRDEYEEDPKYVDTEGRNYGQRTRDTFHLADVFIPLDDEDQLNRFLGLVFANPFATPTREEYAMFLAFGAALRSGDLSRQVGALVMSASGDVVAVGANDVPRAGGGLYWPGGDDQRDWCWREDSNEVQRDEIIGEVLKLTKPDGVDEGNWVEQGRRKLKVSRLTDITEYGRATHAEMEALLSCARSGISTSGATLFSTTFPCHNCAKHIIAAGVSRVVYVEPYPKSQAKTLFKDSVALDRVEAGQRKVLFESFVGVGPRRFFDLFSVALSSGRKVERKRSGRIVSWSPDKAVARVPCLPNSYLEREQLAAKELLARTEESEERP
jgi:deoxycytidylate deaminase